MITVKFIGGPKDGTREAFVSISETHVLETGVYRLKDLHKDKASMVWREAKKVQTGNDPS